MQHLQKTGVGGPPFYGACLPIPIQQLTSPLRICLYFQSLPRCPFCNSFLLMVFHLMGGWVPPLLRISVAYPSFPTPIPFLFISLRTLLHSPKSQLFCFQTIPHSFAKTPGGRGVSITGGR